MDFLDNLVLPQSAQHMHLLKGLLVLTLLLLIPYFSYLVGSLILSVYYNRKGVKTNNKNHLTFAKEIIDLATKNKSIFYALGLIPFISLIFVFAQLLHLAELNITGYLIVSLIFFVTL